MLRKHVKRLIVFLVITMSILAMFTEGYATGPDVTLVVNPKATEIHAGAGKIVITVDATGKNLTFTWKLSGPGKLEEEGAAAFYLPPEKIDQKSASAVVTVTVKEPSGQATIKSVTFTILPKPEETAPPSPDQIPPKIKGFDFGILAGLNLATLKADDENYDGYYRLGFGVGAVINYNLNEHVAVSSEPMYLQKGAEEIKLTYLELPMMLKYTFGTGKIKPYFMAGPTFGVNLGAEEEYWGDLEVKSLDLGLGLGGGISIPIGNNSIFVEARYALGLTNINDQTYRWAPLGDGDAKTRCIQIFGGIIF